MNEIKISSIVFPRYEKDIVARKRTVVHFPIRSKIRNEFVYERSDILLCLSNIKDLYFKSELIDVKIPNLASDDAILPEIICTTKTINKMLVVLASITEASTGHINDFMENDAMFLNMCEEEYKIAWNQLYRAYPQFLYNENPLVKRIKFEYLTTKEIKQLSSDIKTNIAEKIKNGYSINTELGFEIDSLPKKDQNKYEDELFSILSKQAQSDLDKEFIKEMNKTADEVITADMWKELKKARKNDF